MNLALFPEATATMSVAVEEMVGGRFSKFDGSSAVQEILEDSVDREIRQSDDIIQRLHPNVSELTDHLILTSASMVTPQLLESLNVSCVINCAPELPDLPLQNEDIIYHKIIVLDSASWRISAYFDDAADLIHKVAQSGGHSLVFCVAGVSRSASVCIAYLMKHHNMCLLDAYNFVKRRRPRIKPNCGFFKQLIEYEKSLFGCNTVEMVYNEFVQMEIPDVYEGEYRIVMDFEKKSHVRN